jgi:hypothetical protein
MISLTIIRLLILETYMESKKRLFVSLQWNWDNV